MTRPVTGRFGFFSAVAASLCLALASPAVAQTAEESTFHALPSYRALMQKIRDRDPITVAFLGGSITAGATTQPLTDPDGAYDVSWFDREQDCWRARLFNKLRQRYESYPGQFKMINASLSGTGSVLGTFRYHDDVGIFEPDLLFVEFAVNDSSMAEISLNPFADCSIPRTLLSIVEQARRMSPETAIFMPISTMGNLYADPHPLFNLSRAMTKDAAIEFKVPYEDLGETFYGDDLPGGLTIDDLYLGIDGVPGNRLHPSPFGHLVYASTVFRRIESILNRAGDEFEAPSYDLPDQLQPFPLSPRLVKPAEIVAPPGFDARLNEEDWDKHPIFINRDALFVDETAITLSYDFQGSAVALWWEWIYSDESIHGRIQVSLDNEFLGTFVSDIMDPTMESRLSRYLIVGETLDPTVTHNVQIKIPSFQPDLLPDMNLALFGLCIDEG